MTKLVVGLGNPGAEYAKTRHNAGFMAIDALVQKLNLGKPEKNNKYELWLWHENGSKVLFVKPQTFMNKSGEAVSELVRFFKIIDEDVYVLHDDVDIELGTIRLRFGGGSGGHNGINSIQQMMGHDKFRKVKIGISRPPENIPTDAYVLQAFTQDEMPQVEKIIDEAAKIVVECVSDKREFVEETIRV